MTRARLAEQVVVPFQHRQYHFFTRDLQGCWVTVCPMPGPICSLSIIVPVTPLKHHAIHFSKIVSIFRPYLGMTVDCHIRWSI
jgi:hypothetical protein